MVFNKQSIGQIIDLTYNFESLLKDKKRNLPYQINIIDELRANENAHSRIFIKLIKYSENNIYPFLELFIKYLDLNFKDKVVRNPTFTAEKDRIDALIQDKDGKYAIIIENKIHGAPDQKKQLERYINIIKDNGFDQRQIFVLYLTRNGGSPTEKSIEDKQKTEFANQYLDINYRDHILPWLEECVLPSCRFKDVLLISAIQQYIDHLNGMFLKRTIEKDMNEELKKELVKKLKLSKESDKLEKLKILSLEKNRITKVQNYMNEIQKDIVLDIIREWHLKMKNEYSTYKIVTNAFDKKCPNEYIFLGIIFIYKEIEFTCAIGLDDFSSTPYFGLTRRGSTDQKEEEINSFLTEKINNRNFSPSPRWYGYEKTEFSIVYSRFDEMCRKVLSVLE
ncbi:MAG: hypothetical protein GQ564_17545 [Bacteroidales bacterium]|nr:hypothetical protein [Bacteroidales bacterium]